MDFTLAFMMRKLATILSVLAAFYTASTTYAAPDVFSVGNDCLTAIAGKLEHNTNAATDRDDYTITRDRLLDEVSEKLKFNPDEIGPDDVVFDAGSGLGYAGLELAYKNKAHVISVNKQDYWGEARELLKSKPVDELFEILYQDLGEKGVMYEIKLDPAFRYADTGLLAHALQMDLRILTQVYPSAEERMNAYRHFVFTMLERLNEVFESGRFDYRADYVETVLSQIRPGTITFYMDCWGSYPYSKTRLEQLHLSQIVLAPRGQSRIWVPYGITGDMVYGWGPQPLDLTGFLKKWHPAVFQSDDSHGLSHVLIMQKDIIGVQFKIPLRERNAPTPHVIDTPFFKVFTSEFDYVADE